MFRTQTTPSDAPPPYNALPTPIRASQSTSGIYASQRQPALNILRSASNPTSSQRNVPLPRTHHVTAHAAPAPRPTGSTGTHMTHAATDPRRTTSAGPLDTNSARAARQQTARETLAAITAGAYSAGGVPHELHRRVRTMLSGVRFYPAEEALPAVATNAVAGRTRIKVVNMTTLDAARLLDREHRVTDADSAARGGGNVRKEDAGWDWGQGLEKAKKEERRHSRPPIGILSSASPNEPAGSFRNGDSGQELSIARASTLSAALESPAAQPFYALARGPNSGTRGARDAAYYTHALVYATDVTVFRDEAGAWTPPLSIDVVTCAAVHAGDVRAAAINYGIAATESRIARITTARLERVLNVFAQRGVRTLVLPAFGAGSFRNNIGAVARAYAELLLTPGAPLARGVFERVVFAVTPAEQCAAFADAFWAAQPRPAQVARNLIGNEDGAIPLSQYYSMININARRGPANDGNPDSVLGDARSGLRGQGGTSGVDHWRQSLLDGQDGALEYVSE